MGGDFIRNRRLELAFLNTRNKPLASFLSFFCKNVSYLSFGMGSSSKGVVFFFLDNDLDFARFDKCSDGTYKKENHTLCGI